MGTFWGCICTSFRASSSRRRPYIEYSPRANHHRPARCRQREKEAQSRSWEAEAASTARLSRYREHYPERKAEQPERPVIALKATPGALRISVPAIGEKPRICESR